MTPTAYLINILAFPIRIGTDGSGGFVLKNFFTGDLDKVKIFGSALKHEVIFDEYLQGRDNTGTYAPSLSPNTLSPTAARTARPTASPITSSPTPGPDGVSS